MQKVKNNPKTSSASIGADNKKNNKVEETILKKQPMCPGNDAQNNWQEDIKILKAEHETYVGALLLKHNMEVENLKAYYSIKLGEFDIENVFVANNSGKHHENMCSYLRELNYSQGIRQEAALRNMRELTDKMRQDHQREIRGMQIIYDNLVKEHENKVKSLIEEKELLSTEYEGMLQHFRTLTQGLTDDFKTTMTNVRTEYESSIKTLRDQYKSPLVISSPDRTKQNRTEVEELQRKIAEEEQQRTVITPTTLVGHEENDANITTSSSADDDVDTTTSTIPDDDVDTITGTIPDDDAKAPKLSLLSEYISSKESNCSTQVDAHSPQKSHDNSKDED